MDPQALITSKMAYACHKFSYTHFNKNETPLSSSLNNLFY